LDLSKGQALAQLAQLLGLQSPPARIEGYDISHMSGTNVVASMVVFTNGVSDRAQYRKFKMHVQRNDDTANMRETIRRRFSAKNVKAWGMPDLLLIDGGKGQLNAVLCELEVLGVNVPAIGVAKRDEEIVIAKGRSPIDESYIEKMVAKPTPGAVVIDSSGYYFVNLHVGRQNAGSHSKNLRGGDAPSPYEDTIKLFQRIRDEAHRFAVSYHTTLKRANATKSVLSTITGVGPATQKKLVRAFGSVRGVRIVNTAGPQLLQSLAIPIAFQTDQLLLSHLGQSQALAEYGLANRLFNMLTQTVMAAGVAMWPMFARARADKRVESPFKPAIAFSGGGFLLALVLVAITPWAARVMSGGEVVLPSVLVWAFAAYVAVEAGKQPLGMYMTDPRGLQFQVIPVLILVPMNLAISWVLIGPFDAAGPILGSVISVVLCQILPYAWWVRRDVARRRRELAQQ